MLEKYLISKFLIFNGSGYLTNILPSSNGKKTVLLSSFYTSGFCC